MHCNYLRYIQFLLFATSSLSAVVPRFKLFKQSQNGCFVANALTDFIMREVTTPTPFFCMALCQNTLKCRSIVWQQGAYLQCILVGSFGVKSWNNSLYLASSVHYTSMISETQILKNGNISTGSFGVANGSNPNYIFCSNPQIYYRSAATSSGGAFRITFNTPLNIARIRLFFVDVGAYNVLQDAHFHNDLNEYLYSVKPTPLIPNTHVEYFLNTMALTRTLRFCGVSHGMLAFNALQLYDVKSNIIYP